MLTLQELRLLRRHRLTRHQLQSRRVDLRGCRHRHRQQLHGLLRLCLIAAAGTGAGANNVRSMCVNVYAAGLHLWPSAHRVRPVWTWRGKQAGCSWQWHSDVSCGGRQRRQRRWRHRPAPALHGRRSDMSTTHPVARNAAGGCCRVAGRPLEAAGALHALPILPMRDRGPKSKFVCYREPEGTPRAQHPPSTGRTCHCKRPRGPWLLQDRLYAAIILQQRAT